MEDSRVPYAPPSGGPAGVLVARRRARKDARRDAHHQRADSSAIVAPAGETLARQDLSQSELHRSLHEGAADLAWNSVAGSTRQQYLMAWDKWTDYWSTLNHGATVWSNVLLMRDFCPAAKRYYLCGFVTFLHHVAKNKADTISATLTGVRKFFTLHVADDRCFEDPVLLACKKGCKRADSQGGCFTEHALPVTLEMVTRLADIRAQGSKSDRMLRMGCLMAFFCMLRASEYVQETRSHRADHSIKAANVHFQIHEGSWVESTLLRPLGVVLSTVLVVKVSLPSMKNDQFCQGNAWSFRNRNLEADRFDMVAELFHWAMEANARPADPFMSYRTSEGQFIPLRYDTVNGAVKAVAASFGFDANQFSTHSFRVGAVTGASAAGVSEGRVMRYGRWRSLETVLRYNKNSTAENDEILDLLSSDRTLSTTDVRVQAVHRLQRQDAMSTGSRRSGRGRGTHAGRGGRGR